MFYRGHDIENLILLPICRSITKNISNKIISEIYQNNEKDRAGELHSEYKGTTTDIRDIIFNRDDLNIIPFFTQIKSKTI